MLVIVATVVLLACNKDKFQTKPTIELKSISSDEVPPGGITTIRLKYTDKEGDLGDGTLTYIRIRTNGTPIPDPNNNDKVDTVRTPIPEFPPEDRGEIDLKLDYNFLNEDPGRNDTMFFKLSVLDQAGNSSDTLTTSLIVARQI